MLKISQGDIVCDYISNVLSDIYLVLGYDKHFELGCCYNMIVNGYDAYKQAKYQSTMLYVLRLGSIVRSSIDIFSDTLKSAAINIVNKSINEDLIQKIRPVDINDCIGHIDFNCRKILNRNMFLGLHLDMYTQSEFDNYIKSFYESCIRPIKYKKATKFELGRIYLIDDTLYVCYGKTSKDYLGVNTILYAFAELGKGITALAKRDNNNIISLGKLYTNMLEIPPDNCYILPKEYKVVKQSMSCRDGSLIYCKELFNLME